MTQTRTFLLIAWLFVAGWLWLQWTESNTPKADAPGATTTATDAGLAPASAALPANALPGASAAPAPTALPGMSASPANAPGAGAPVVHLRNDVLELAVDARGNVVGSRLLAYPQEKKPGSPVVELLRLDGGQHFTASAGFITLDGAQHQARLSPQFAPVGGPDHTLPANADALRVALDWNDAATGLHVRRTLVLERGSYLLKVEDSVANSGTAPARL